MFRGAEADVELRSGSAGTMQSVTAMRKIRNKVTSACQLLSPRKEIIHRL